MTDLYAGYIRVSSKRQAEDGHSLEAQKEGIIAHVKYKTGAANLTVPIFADEGISGTKVKNRAGLQVLLGAAQRREFNRVVISRTSRLGRNARELLNNVNLLKEEGVTIDFLKENIDTGGKTGRLTLTIMAGIAEMEAENIGEASLESKRSLAAKNIPAVGNLPFGRTFDKKTGKWGLLPGVKKDMEGCAREYLKGRSLYEIADELCARGYKAKYTTLVKVLNKVAGDKWTVKFKDDKEPKIFDVPELVDKALLKRVKDRLKLRRRRPPGKKSDHQYLLRQLAYCEECGCLLYTATNNKKPYYEHRRGSNLPSCSQKGLRVFTSHLDHAVLRTVWENIYDEEGFNTAIKSNMPDEKEVGRLTASIKSGKTRLASIANQKNRLVAAVADGALTNNVIKEKMDALIAQEQIIMQEMATNQAQLDKLGSIAEIQADAQFIRRQYLQYFSSEERLKEMTFEERRQLIEMFFEGSDFSGNAHGVYVINLSEKFSRKRRYDYTIYSNLLLGTRKMAGRNYNAAPTDKEFQEWGRSYQAPTNNAAVAARGKHPSLDMAVIHRNYGRSRKPKNKVVVNTLS